MRKFAPMTCVAVLLCVSVARDASASTQREKAMELYRLAQEEFETVTRADVFLIRGVATGEPIDFSDLPFSESVTDAEKEAARILHANRLVWLCSNAQAAALVSHKGISLSGAKIQGKINLAFANISFPLALEECEIPGGISLKNAEIRELSLSGSHVGDFYADGLRVERDLLLSWDFQANSEVSFHNARIGGDLDCSGGYFLNPGPDALFMHGISIEGSLFLRYGFHGTGRVCLQGARIRGNLDCEGGQFENPKQDALFADGANILGDVLMRDDFVANGRVSFHGTKIEGHLDCGAGQFLNEKSAALHFAGSTISSDVKFNRECVINGLVDLTGVRIGGDLECENVSFTNGPEIVFSGKRLSVAGDCFFGLDSNKGFTAEGIFVLESSTIGGTFLWVGMRDPAKVSLNLRFAKVGRLWYEPAAWPPQNQLSLHGLVYDVFYNYQHSNVETLIDWLRRQPTDRFRPQPYEQLASVLRRGGNESEANQVLMAKEEDRTRELSPSGQMIHKLMGVTIGYGYDPWRALWIGLAIVGVGTFIFGVGSASGLIAATKAVEHVSDTPDSTVKLSDDYPRFNALVYSLDMFVPLLDLHQANYWLPSSERGRSLRAGFFRFSTGGTLRLYLGIHIYLGWALTTLLAVGLSGLVQS